MIVSGTGVSIRDVSDVVSSSVAKFSEEHERYTNIGAFGDGLDQRNYIEQYLLATFLRTEEGEQLVAQMEYWLSGR